MTNFFDKDLWDTPKAYHTEAHITKLACDFEGKDNLLQFKVFQTHFANKTHHTNFTFAIGDKVMLSTLHCCQEYKSKGDTHATKFS